MSNQIFTAIGIDRHRMFRDGDGVTTLVCAYGCPLRCKMCLNPQSFHKNTRVKDFTVQQLYDTVKIDNLYFLSTGGGVTFGGGEPLEYADFISEFRKVCGDGWKLNAETSLNVEKEKVITASKVIDDYIVDIKDINPEIYKRYTGRDNQRVLDNLKLLISLAGADKIVVRVPLINGYNTEEDCRKSEEYLRSLGITRIDRFEYIYPEKKYEQLIGESNEGKG